MYFSTKVLIGVTISTTPTGDETAILCACKGLAVCRAKAVFLILTYFKTLSIGQVPGTEPATSCSAVKWSTD